MPIARPSSSSVSTERRISQMMPARWAPSAMRIPISPVRRVTLYATVPYKPTQRDDERQQRERRAQPGERDLLADRLIDVRGLRLQVGHRNTGIKPRGRSGARRWQGSAGCPQPAPRMSSRSGDRRPADEDSCR